MKGTGCRLNGKIETVNTTGKNVSFCGLNLGVSQLASSPFGDIS